MKEIAKRNWFFILFLAAVMVVFVKRYIYLPMPVVSIPDTQVSFSTEDGILEQTWQPVIKKIAGIELPYQAENDFSCDAQLKIYSDDYSQVIAEETKEAVSFKAGQAGTLSFTFRKTSVIPGERYHIQISLINPSAKGVLKISSGSNYGGCTIAGQEIGQAAAITVTFLKYSKLFWLTAVLFPLLTLSLLAMVITGRKWEETVALSLFTEGIILYVFGLLEHLQLGLFILYLLSVICLISAIFIYNRKKLCLDDLLSPGLWIYLVLFGIILVTCNGDWIAIRDELRHWEIAARDMFYYNSFAKHINTTVILPRYLPLAALIEYVFEFMNGMFSEDILFIAYQTMLLSALIVISKLLQKSGGIKFVVLTIVTMVCIPVIFFHNIASCIMVDSLLAAVFAYILICYFTDRLNPFNIVRIGSAIVVLVLIKDVGLIYAAMVSIVIFGDILFTQIRLKHLDVKQFLFPVAGAVLAVAIFFSWQFYLSIPVDEATTNQNSEIALQESNQKASVINDENEENNESFDTAISASGITLSGIGNVLTGKGEEYQYQVTYNFVQELFEGSTFSFGAISFSFMDLLAIISFGVILLGYLGFWKEEKKRMYGIAVLFIASSLCLCFFLQITYWFTFGMYEALDLTSVSRYLAPYICAVMIAVFYMICERVQLLPSTARKENCLIGVLAFILVISMPVTDLARESKDKEGNATENVVYGHSDLAEILRSVAKRGEKVYFVCSNSGGLSEYVFRNTVCPIISEHEYWNIVSTQEIAEEACREYGGDGFGVEVLSVEKWKDKLSDCQYVVIFHADELFRQSYGEVFGETEIVDGSVYRVLNESGDVALSKIGTTGIKGWY